MKEGERIGRLLILDDGIMRNNRRFNLCLCDCGKRKLIRCDSLGKTLSCGCMARENVRERMKTHGMSKSVEFMTWDAVYSRCYRKNRQNYHRYGGRGIIMSDEWKNSFEEFYNDMGPRPSNKHSIDRIDNDGNYCKENCKWSTQIEQANNTNRNVFIEYEGQKRTTYEWDRFLGLPLGTILKRLRKGWEVFKIIQTPLRKHIGNKYYYKEQGK